ncbi:MAG: hypothetical protein IJ715_01140 [Bacilli bacterium]|nr:hypothetical protein [Bacilli bacterium]
MYNNKFAKYEKIPLKTYIDSIGLSEKDALRLNIMLYHGIRFDAINRLESILKTGSILCGNRVSSSYKSYDGTTKYLYISSDSDENCNMGKYISVMPCVDDLEFNTFVRQNIFFAIKGTIEAYKTIHLSYDDYCELRQSDMNYKNLYSYAFNECLVKDEIPLDDVLYIGIDSRYYSGDYDKTVSNVKKLMSIYEIAIPFIDTYTYNELFCYNNNKKMVKTK